MMQYFENDVDKELMLGWADDLESGKFKQGRSTLVSMDRRNPDSKEHEKIIEYCCLGVLGVRLGKTVEELKNQEYLGYLGICPQGIINETVFSKMNDQERLPFSEIAAKIRRDLKNC